MNRRLVQVITTVLTNSQLQNFYTGKIYTGPLKNICVPGLNCYSCPGAVASCPIGSLQSVAGSVRYEISFYILGLLMLFGTLGGRFICGWLCPFGLFQDLLHKIKSKKLKFPKFLRWTKYGIFLYFVLLYPVIIVNEYGVGGPGFCTFICPSGTIFASIPLLLTNPSLRNALGLIFNIKAAIAILTVIGSVYMYRFFCKLLCPLGAFYSVFNKIAFYQLHVDDDLCVDCGKCEKVCQMDINPKVSPNHMECIRCMACVEACPVDAISRKGHREQPVQLEVR